jgi:DNA-directed RNA polymerase specialized sigma24 family protein
LALCYYEGFSWGEISEALELPESQVSLLHGRALMVLKDSLRRKEERKKAGEDQRWP